MNSSTDSKNKKNNNNKKPLNPKVISKSKYFKVGIRDSNRIKLIKEGMNNLFDLRNHELEEAFLQEATQYTERILGETRRFQHNEEESQEIMSVIFNNTIEEPELEEPEELIIEGKEEERLEREAEGDEDETLSSEEVWELNERIQAEDQEEYERLRAEMEEEEAEANKHN